MTFVPVGSGLNPHKKPPQIHVEMPDELYRRFANIAKKHKVSKSRLARQMIEYALANIDPKS